MQTLRRYDLPRRLGALSLLIAGIVAPVAAQNADDDWHPTSEFEGKFDWIQMTSGEWVKGEIIAMYNDELEFDSDEFDDLTLDWEDIQQIRSSQFTNVGLSDQRSASGILIVDGDTVTVVGETTRTFAKSEVISITAGPPKEINFWSMKVFFGLDLQEGNTEVVETDLHANLKRRTIRNRIVFDSIVNTNRTDGMTVTDSKRAGVTWDKFISDRFFVTPTFSEYFRDPLQNIGRRITIGVGAGYQILDSPKLEWQVSGGPAYQETTYDTVAVGEPESEETVALILNTSADWDITEWLEFQGSYSAQFVNEESGSYNHHLVISLESDITNLIDLDITWVWDRIQDPVADAAGIVPEQDDFRTSLGVTFEF